MKGCKRCNGKGYIFEKDNNIHTGKTDRIFGFEIPRFASGMTQTTCPKCFGKGVR